MHEGKLAECGVLRGQARRQAAKDLEAKLACGDILRILRARVVFCWARRGL